MITFVSAYSSVFQWQDKGKTESSVVTRTSKTNRSVKSVDTLNQTAIGNYFKNAITDDETRALSYTKPKLRVYRQIRFPFENRSLHSLSHR